ncbi:MAG: hypothetical protein ABI356_14470 [Steroidobacteraceae bacterium]
MIAIAVGWAYVASRIHTDYVQTLEAEDNRLRGVGATLRSATLAMLNDGVGAAVAGANELAMAERHLTGCTNVRTPARLFQPKLIYRVSAPVEPYSRWPWCMT